MTAIKTLQGLNLPELYEQTEAHFADGWELFKVDYLTVPVGGGVLEPGKMTVGLLMIVTLVKSG